MSATNLFSRQAQAEPSIPLEGPGPGVRDEMWVEKYASCLQWGRRRLTFIDLQDYIMEGFHRKLLYFYLKGEKMRRECYMEPDIEADEKRRLKTMIDMQ